MKIFTILILLIGNLVYGDVWVSHTQIIGNQKVKDKVIQREINHIIPGEFDSTTTQKDRNRIYNLGLFSTVELYYEDSALVVYVVESPSVIPFPIIDYDEAKGADGWSFGGGISMLNFRGLNEKLSLGSAFGANKFYFLKFSDPWIAGDHISINGNLGNFLLPNAVYDYNLRIKYLNVELGFYKNLIHKFRFEGGYENINLTTRENSENIEPTPESELNSYNILFVAAKYTIDTRDVYKDPTLGILYYNELTYVRGIKNSPSLWEYNFLLKKYYLQKNWILDPVFIFFSHGKLNFVEDLPIFKRIYLGGEGLVRGYSPIPTENPVQTTEKIEVEEYLFQSIQLQFTLLRRKDFGRIEFGIDGLIFGDYGTGSLTSQKFKLSDSIFGYGFGVRLFLSGINYIGLDLGFNPYTSTPRLHLSKYAKF